MATVLRRGLTPVRTVLDNGAVVLVQETSTIPAVTLMATFLAGSVDDPAGTPGLAYMMGRLLDRGTERRAGEVIAQELDDRGADPACRDVREALQAGVCAGWSADANAAIIERRAPDVALVTQWFRTVRPSYSRWVPRPEQNVFPEL